MKIILSLCSMLLAATMLADDMTADQIIEKANLVSYYAAKDGRATVSMTIVDKDGGTRTRDFIILRLNLEQGGNQKFYVYFTGPADVRQMAYLVWKHAAADREDDRWMWLPALNLQRRIAPGDKRTSFVGSDFLYEDVSGRNTNDDAHELLETTDKHYKIRNTPKDPNSVRFSYYDVMICKDTFLPLKAIYYDKNGNEYRLVEALEIKTIQGHPTVVKAKASDLVSGSHTINEFTKVEYDLGLNERIFTERFLRRPPREVR